jgi:hypothetical protein
MAAEAAVRREFIRAMSRTEMLAVLSIAQREGGTPYALWRDDALGFVQDVLGENVWSTSRRILEALPSTQKIAIPSCFSSSKSWTLSRCTLWFSNVHPVGTARVVTLAPLWRQVTGIMWGAEIRGAHARAGLPGQVGQIQLKMPNKDGVLQLVAEGFVGNPRNEASTQGIHAPHVLVLVDEAGGIPHGVGRNLAALLTAEGTQMVAIGNPPADNEGSWFEELCNRDDVLTVPISALSTPNFTGEKVARCKSCPAEAPEHTLAKHLVSRAFVDEIRREFGEDSPYYQAKVLARFPKGGSLRILPSAWVDAAADCEEPEPDPEWVALNSLGLEGEDQPWLVKRRAWVRLGVDVAADGGDELVIALMVGDLITLRHISSGSANAHAPTVAGVILEHIRKAQAIAVAIGSTVPVRVKIDGIGVGWGVAGWLQSWGDEGLHDADIVPVVVSEGTNRDPESTSMRPYRKRDEMWVGFRSLVQPSQDGNRAIARLRVDRRTLAQLCSPTYGTTASGGWTVVESKASMRKRGLSSPDRAEAVLLAAYEPAATVSEDDDFLLV